MKAPIWALIVVILDQLIKFIIRYSLDLGSSIAVLPFFNIVNVSNTGAGFSILQGMNSLLIWVSILALGLILYFWDKIEEKEHVFYAVIIGGILGNLIDRIFLGGVTDFLDFYAFGYHWPSFNIADSSLVIGVILLMLYSWKR